MIRIVDEWAAHQDSYRVLAQIGNAKFRPRNVEFKDLMTPEEFVENVRNSAVVVAHAGIGTILTALSANVPIVVFPRRASLGEHRNDHQLATVEHLKGRGYMSIATDEEVLLERLNSIDLLPKPAHISDVASQGLLDALRGLVGSSRKSS